jgi:hypothetical protein
MEHTTAPDCCWPGCRAPQTSDDLKLCGPHAFHQKVPRGLSPSGDGGIGTALSGIRHLVYVYS